MNKTCSRVGKQVNRQTRKPIERESERVREKKLTHLEAFLFFIFPFFSSFINGVMEELPRKIKLHYIFPTTSDHNDFNPKSAEAVLQFDELTYGTPPATQLKPSYRINRGGFANFPKPDHAGSAGFSRFSRYTLILLMLL